MDNESPESDQSAKESEEDSQESHTQMANGHHGQDPARVHQNPNHSQEGALSGRLTVAAALLPNLAPLSSELRAKG